MFGAQRVQMTQMPQMVALFNGVGGGAAAPIRLPARAVLGPERPLSARMKQTAQAR
ncbi:MAG: NAD(P)(+) transhydrogenase (Re/Si-specific) subunit beta [Marmoricola sp.]